MHVGSPNAYLTVGTYPLQNAYNATVAAAGEAGAVKVPMAGGVAFYSSAHPTSVYIAFPGSNEQIEVYDPSAKKLHKLVASSKVKPVS